MGRADLKKYRENILRASDPMLNYLNSILDGKELKGNYNLNKEGTALIRIK